MRGYGIKMKQFNENQPNRLHKCHQCKGSGKVTGNPKGEGIRRSNCLYCRGKGYRTNAYGKD